MYLQKQEKQNLKEDQGSRGQCYRIEFDPSKQLIIQDFLNTVADKPPSFLLPVSEYHNKLKKKNQDKFSKTPSGPKNEIPNSENETEEMNEDNPIPVNFN